jgi:hypothetical protein
MTIEYELTKDDVLAFNLYHRSHSPTLRRQYYFAWLLPALAWLTVCTALWYCADQRPGEPLQTFLDLLPMFCGVPIYLAIFPWARRRGLRRVLDSMMSEGKNRAVFGRRTVTLSREGIAQSGEFASSSISWRTVERVVRDGDHAYIYSGAVTAIIVPRRAFAGESEFDDFVMTTRRYHEDATAGV